MRVLSNEAHRDILDALLNLQDGELLEAMNGLYRMVALMMAEVVNAVERARHVRDHRGVDDTAMLQVTKEKKRRLPQVEEAAREKKEAGSLSGEAVSLAQTKLDVIQQPPGKMKTTDWFFNHFLFDLRTDLEESSALMALTKAVILGRKLFAYRAKPPDQEGLGLSRMDRPGALLAAFELHEVEAEITEETLAWADE